ncbi:hypothetical protein [Listeria ivanovii]|nr:hypothetical protein [Listeria ivanovii]
MIEDKDFMIRHFKTFSEAIASVWGKEEAKEFLLLEAEKSRKEESSGRK